MTATSATLQVAAASPLARLGIVLLDADMQIAFILRSMLLRLGFKRIQIARDTNDCVELLRSKDVDMLITDWLPSPMDGITLLNHVRKNPDSPNRLLPVLMVTARNARKDVENARDAGVNEYVLRPFSAKAIFSRIVQIVEAPRSFVLSKEYVGPCRRSVSVPPPGLEERRGARPPLVARDYAKSDRQFHAAKIIFPDFSLKKKVGAKGSIAQLITPEMLDASQQEFQTAENDALKWLREDVLAIEQKYAALCAGTLDTDLLPQLSQNALSVKARGGLFGYARAAEIADSLYHFCRDAYSDSNVNHLLIIEKHIHALSALFSAAVKGDGGALGHELKHDLQVLVAKYR